MTWRARLRDRNQNESGAVFIEFALIVPFLVLIALGIVEYGLAWNAKNNVNAAARDGARAGTSATVYLTADQSILRTIGTSLNSDEMDGLEKVIVYKAVNATDTTPPTACLTIPNTQGGPTNPGIAAGIWDVCNVYSPGQVKYVLNNPEQIAPWWINAAGTNCDVNVGLDRNWCPMRRNRDLSLNNLDYIGVYIQMKHSEVTHFGFGDQTIRRTAVFRLEPKQRY